MKDSGQVCLRVLCVRFYLCGGHIYISASIVACSQ